MLPRHFLHFRLMLPPHSLILLILICRHAADAAAAVVYAFLSFAMPVSYLP